MSKLPAMQFYPGDWKKDPGVQALSFHDRAVWFEMLLLMHESEQRGKLLLNGKPIPHDALARLIGISTDGLTQSITTMLEYGVSSICDTTGAIMSRRMVRDEHLRQIAKLNGKKGGNPSLVNGGVNHDVKRKQRSSSSSSKKMKGCVSGKTQDDPLFSEFWNAYPRKEAKKRALKAWTVAIRETEPSRIIEAARAYAKSCVGKDVQYVRHPATWLNDGPWEDQPIASRDPYGKQARIEIEDKHKRGEITDAQLQAWYFAAMRSEDPC